MNIDLHLHTNHSDGEKPTKELIKLVNEKKLDLISFTDHDGIGAYTDLTNINTGNIKIIPGIEVTSNYKNEIRDILGYKINLKKMQELLKTFASKEHSIKREKELLTDYTNIFKSNGIIFDEKNIQIKDGKKGEAYLNIFERIKLHKENFQKYPGLKNPSKFFWDNCIDTNSPFYINEAQYYTSLKDAINIIHEADGLAFFAHPCIHYMQYNEVEKMLDEAVSYGLDGVEVLHAKHTYEDREFLYNYAIKHKLYKSGGSDYHGKPKPDIEILKGKGDLNVTYDLIEDWIE